VLDHSFNGYLPVGLSESERWYVLLHEHTHYQAGDHLVKPWRSSRCPCTGSTRSCAVVPAYVNSYGAVTAGMLPYNGEAKTWGECFIVDTETGKVIELPDINTISAQLGAESRPADNRPDPVFKRWKGERYNNLCGLPLDGQGRRKNSAWNI
jgi:hypothetical protein